MGHAVLAIWNHVNPDVEEDYNLWITKEHMPERMGAPGFLRGRRYISINESSRQRYFNLYELESATDSSSPQYMSMLNSPSAWTSRLMPSLVNFTRGTGVVTHSAGKGVAQFMLTVRANESNPNEQVPFPNNALAQWLEKLEWASSVHTGISQAPSSPNLTAEKRLRANGAANELDFSHFLFLESPSKEYLLEISTAVKEKFASNFTSEPVLIMELYQINYFLDRKVEG